MSVSKVILDGVTLIDLTSDTVTANAMLSGITAHALDGTTITGTIASKSAATYTPSTVEQIIASEQYLTGIQTIAGDSNLIAANIASGITIFGITGTHQGGSAAYDTMNASEVWAAAVSGWGAVTTEYEAYVWEAVTAGWGTSTVMSDEQIGVAVTHGWR